MTSDLLRRTGPTVFHSACRRRSSDGGAIPLARVGEFFGAGAEGFLLGQVRRPGFLALGEIGVAAGEELVARLAEALPGGARVVARHGACLLPFLLQLLQLVGGLDPVGGIGQRLGPFDQRELAIEVALALFGADGEELARLGLDRIGGLPVAVPEGLRLGAGRLGDLLPALLDLVEIAGGLLDVVRGRAALARRGDTSC